MPNENKSEQTRPQPKSGINFVLYNSSFDVVEENTGYLPVDDHINAVQILATDKLVMKEAGFLEIFVNNDAQTPVYYDNMMVVMSGGAAVEVNAYYPSGLLITNLSEKRPATPNAYKFNNKEEQKELNLQWLDYGARMYDPIVGRFWTPDPLAEKYYSTSPYAYMLNNPINAIDPDGRDIVVLNALKSAKGHGHAAMLIGNDKTGWRYISKDGRIEDKWYSNDYTGGPAFVIENVEFKSIEEFRKAQSEPDSYYGKYTQDVRFSTNEEQDRKAKKATSKSANSWYHMLFNNCIDAVSAGLKAVGLDPGYSVLGMGNPYADPIVTLSPDANVRFQQIKENNAKEIIPTDNPPEKNRNIGMVLQRFLIQNPNIKVYVY